MATLGTYLQVGPSGDNAVVSIAPTGGAASTIAVLTPVKAFLPGQDRR